MGPAPGRSRAGVAEGVALAVATAALTLAAAAEPLGWWRGDVHQWLPPLSAHLDPTVGVGTPLALLLGVAVVRWGPPLAARLAWRRLLLATWAAGAAWGAALALVRGWAGGIAAPLASDDETLMDVGAVRGTGAVLRTYTDRILLGDHPHWHTYASGHPPLPLLAYTALARAGLGGPAAAGVVTALAGSTAVIAVLVTLRALGDEARARAAAPFLAAPSLVVWIWVSTDGALAALVAWGVALLALAATAAPPRRLLLSLAAGLVLGLGVFGSYGLVLMAPVALAVLVSARTWRPLVPAVAAALVVVAAFAAAGFWWVAGEQTLVVRYYQGKGRLRPYGYWVWADLAVAAATLGPPAVAGLGAALALPARRWRDVPPALWLAAGALLAITAASLSGLSKSEVERIWLPFTVWLVPLATFLRGSPRAWLATGAGWALAVETVLRTTW